MGSVLTRTREIDGAILDDHLATVLTPIVSLLVRNRIGVDKFVRVAKHAYVRAANSECSSSGIKLNYSRLATITGMTRKEVSLLSKQLHELPVHTIVRSKEQRALRVIQGWRMDPRFQNEKGAPAELSLRIGPTSFARLVKAYARDVTPRAVLAELQRLNAVALIQKGNSLRLRSSRAQAGTQNLQALTELARVLQDFVEAATQQRSTGSLQSFFSFKEEAVLLQGTAARFQRVFSHRGSALLESFDQWIAAQRERSQNRNSASESRARVGIGIYLVNDPIVKRKMEPTSRARRRTGLTRS